MFLEDLEYIGIRKPVKLDLDRLDVSGGGKVRGNPK